MKNIEMDVRPNEVEFDYPTLSIEEISKGRGHKSDLGHEELPHNYGEVVLGENRRLRETNRKVSRDSGISHNTLSRIAKIEEKATPEQKKALEKNEVSINEVFTKISKEEKRESREETLKTTPFPSGSYRVIYADPPWDYGSSPKERDLFK